MMRELGDSGLGVVHEPILRRVQSQAEMDGGDPRNDMNRRHAVIE